MLIEGGCDDIKGAESRFFDFVVPACHGQACGILDCVFGKDHPQGMAQSVCRFDVRVFFKQYRSPLLLPVGPFVGRLEQEITRAYKQFLAGVSIGIAVRDILLTVLSGFLHLIVSLLHGIPTVFDAQLLYGITSQFLDIGSGR